jgi:hypothetical protein
METRSQRQNILKQNKFIFDFDEASKEWRANKRKAENGTYIYICQRQTKLGEQCNRKCLTGKEYCKIHNKNII